MIAKAALFALCVAIVLIGAITIDPPTAKLPGEVSPSAKLPHEVLLAAIAPATYLCVRVAKVPVSVAIGLEPETPALVMRRPDAESIGELPRLSLCFALEEVT